MRRPIAVMTVAVVAGVSLQAIAADIEMVPLPGGAFSVKSSDGANVRFKVNETGDVVIPNLPAALAGKPLCWDQATGVLRACPEAVGTDFVPPTITINAPAVASETATQYTTSFSDNVELAYRIFFAASGAPVTMPFAPGLTSATTQSTLNVPLGTIVDVLTLAVDTSGNVAKKATSIATPQTAFKLGTYNILGGSPLPAQFDCRAGASDLNNAPASSATISFADAWSLSGGYTPIARLMLSNGLSVQLPAMPSTTLTALDATSFLYGDTIPMYGRAVYRGEVKMLSASPAKLQIDIQMKCGNDTEGWTYGDKATITAELIP